MGDGNPGEFEKIVDADAKRDEELLTPIRRDPRVGLAVLRAVSPGLPGLGSNEDLDGLFEEVADDLKVDVKLVKEAFETGKTIFEREKKYGD